MVDLTNPVIRATSNRTETPAACTEDGYTGDEANLGLWLSLAAATLLAGAAWVTLGKKRRAYAHTTPVVITAYITGTPCAGQACAGGAVVLPGNEWAEADGAAVEFYASMCFPRKADTVWASLYSPSPGIWPSADRNSTRPSTSPSQRMGAATAAV